MNIKNIKKHQNKNIKFVCKYEMYSKIFNSFIYLYVKNNDNFCCLQNISTAFEFFKNENLIITFKDQKRRQLIIQSLISFK